MTETKQTRQNSSLYPPLYVCRKHCSSICLNITIEEIASAHFFPYLFFYLLCVSKRSGQSTAALLTQASPSLIHIKKESSEQLQKY